jgi:hypothetical protein
MLPFRGSWTLVWAMRVQGQPVPLPLPIWDALSTPWAHRHANMPHPNTLVSMTCTCNLAPSLWRQLRECCAALCQGREAYQHLLSHKPELSDSLGERAAPLPARSRTHPSSFRQVVPPSHLILGLETVGVISVPTRRPYRNHMASIKGACCCAWSPRESASSARRVVFFFTSLPACRQLLQVSRAAKVRSAPPAPVFPPLPSETLFLGPISSGQKFPLLPCYFSRHRRIICLSSPRHPCPTRPPS